MEARAWDQEPTYVVDDVRVFFIVSTDPHVPALTSTAPRREGVSKVKQINPQIELLKLGIFSFVGASIASEAKRTLSFHPAAGLPFTESGVSTFGALYIRSLALEVHWKAQFPPSEI